jgi:hypothetical protein
MWIISKDIIDDGEAVGVRSVDHTEGAELKYKFKMYDDDNILYYEGLSDDCDSEKAFSPLDDFGTGNAGCTEIHYLTNGKYICL